MRSLVFTVGIFLVALATLNGGAAAEPSPPLKIGLLLPFTGALSEFGPALHNGANLAAKHVNEAGGVLGQDIQIVTADSGSDALVAVPAAEQLADVEGVSAIVGPLGSGTTLSVAEQVTIPRQLLLISPASTSPALTTVEDNDYLFRTVPSDTMQGLVLGRLGVQQGFQTACTMYVNDPYGLGLSDEFQKSFEVLGGKVLATVPHESGQASYLPELTQCTQGDPDALAAISWPGDATTYLIEAIDNGLVDGFLFVDATKSPDMVDAVEAAVGAGALDGMFGTASGGVTSEAFDSEYEAEYGEPPSMPFIGEAYSAVALLALAAKKAGSTDSTAIRDALREVANPPGQTMDAGSEGIAQALQLIGDGTEINYLGHTSVLDLDFDENGDVTTAAIEVWTIESGQIVTVRVDYLGPQGDADADGAVTIVDALLVAQLMVGLITPGNLSPQADVDGDAEITIVDALLVAQKVVGLIP